MRRFDSANKILERIPKIYIPLCIIVIEKEKERQDGRDKRIQQRIDRKFHSKRYDTVVANFTIGLRINEARGERVFSFDAAINKGSISRSGR